jgi:uncharacterized protein
MRRGLPKEVIRLPYGFLDLLSTPSVLAAQTANGSKGLWEGFNGGRTFDRFTANEAAFISARDSFYIATVTENGWPYVQHRGGPPGFLKVLDERTLGFVDFRGNRQYISVGNMTDDDRTALILVDYPNRVRLKILARSEIRDLSVDSDLAGQLSVKNYKATPERALLLHLEAFDWNCPQHITPRFTAVEIEAAMSPLRSRLAALEAENQLIRDQLAMKNSRDNK